MKKVIGVKDKRYLIETIITCLIICLLVLQVEDKTRSIQSQGVFAKIHSFRTMPQKNKV